MDNKSKRLGDINEVYDATNHSAVLSCTKALRYLRNDGDIFILPADKGQATVVVGHSEYDEKMLHLLVDDHTYKILKRDPTPVLER